MEFRVMMKTSLSVKKEMQAKIEEVGKENSALISKVQALEYDWEKFRNELALTVLEMLMAQTPAHENMSALASLQDKKIENEKRMKSTVISLRDERISLSIFIAKLKSRLADKTLENRALNRKLASQSEPKKIWWQKPPGKHSPGEI